MPAWVGLGPGVVPVAGIGAGEGDPSCMAGKGACLQMALSMRLKAGSMVQGAAGAAGGILGAETAPQEPVLYISRPQSPLLQMHDFATSFILYQQSERDLVSSCRSRSADLCCGKEH